VSQIWLISGRGGGGKRCFKTGRIFPSCPTVATYMYTPLYYRVYARLLTMALEIRTLMEHYLSTSDTTVMGSFFLKP